MISPQETALNGYLWPLEGFYLHETLVKAKKDLFSGFGEGITQNSPMNKFPMTST